jgi:uncharacterized protein (DUF58 family)
MLDQSESMHYRSAGTHLSKLEYAQLVACCIAFLVVNQRDRAGLLTFSGDIDDWLQPSSSPNQLDDMIRMMESTTGGKKTDLAGVIERALPRLMIKGLVVIVSDLFDNLERLLGALKLLRLAGHDALLLHVMDPAELSFPFERMARFEGLEGLPSVVTDPLLIGGAYRKAAADFCRQLEVGCQQLNVDYFLLQTHESLAASLPRILSHRLMRGA